MPRRSRRSSQKRLIIDISQFKRVSSEALASSHSCASTNYNDLLQNTFRTESEDPIHQLQIFKPENKIFKKLKSSNSTPQSHALLNSIIPTAIDESTYDVLLYIEVQTPQCTSETKNRLMISLCMKGDQTLADLMSAINCPTDYISISPIEKQAPAETFEQIDVSFFMIENILYFSNDCINNPYSNELKAWAKKHGVTGINSMKNGANDEADIAHLMTTKLADLSIREENPYLYVHKFSCGHKFTISKITYQRLNELSFPVLIWAKEYVPKLCHACEIRKPCFATSTSSSVDKIRADFAGSGYLLWCNECYDLFHFDSEGKPAPGTSGIKTMKYECLM